MKINCPLTYETQAPSTDYFDPPVLIRGEEKFGNRIFRYKLKDSIQKTPGIYDLIIKAIAPTTNLDHFQINTFKLELTKNCEDEVFNQIIYGQPLSGSVPSTSPTPQDPLDPLTMVDASW